MAALFMLHVSSCVTALLTCI